MIAEFPKIDDTNHSQLKSCYLNNIRYNIGLIPQNKIDAVFNNSCSNEVIAPYRALNLDLKSI